MLEKGISQVQGLQLNLGPSPQLTQELQHCIAGCVIPQARSLGSSFSEVPFCMEAKDH